MLSKIVDNTSCYNLYDRDLLREVIVKISLERVDTQEGVTVEVLLNSGAMGLVMSLEFVRKQGFRLKKIERPIYVRNVNSSFNKEGLIKHMIEVNIYYQGHRERTEINIIIGIEGEEGHNELVEEVVRRLAENNLYVKPEKCKWKVREVGFLGVVIGLEGIKMEEEKVKGVLD